MKRTALFGVLLAAAPSALLAEMNYSGFEIGYVDTDLDAGIASVSGDGFEITGTYDLNDKIFLLGKWQDEDYDLGISGSTLELGAGLHHALSANLDFVGTLSYVDTEVEYAGFSVSDDALAISGGVRTRLGGSFELDASLRFADYDEGGSDTGWLFGGRYYFSERMALLFGTEFYDDVDVMRLGFRAEF